MTGGDNGTLRRAAPTVNAEGEKLAPLISDVKIRQAVTHQDERGSLAEIYNQTWGFDAIPMVHAYLVTVRPGRVKGWALHEHQVDRYFFCNGTLKLVLFDYREASPTYKMLNVLYFSEINRSLVSVPPGVFHAVENVGTVDGLMFNIPSEPYNYEVPDKLVLPLDNAIIPYSFNARRGY